MKLLDNFSTCRDTDCTLIVKQQPVPVFQNKVYPTREEALNADRGNVELVQSKTSGFVFNSVFDPAIMNYDEKYQNEQGNSSVFRDHLNSVLNLLKSFGISDKKVVEVGCGKGGFFEIMLNEGVDCFGFDPTYEGNNPRISKEYFGEKHANLNADVIIMRHTLEHIPNPFSFIHTLAKANNYKGYLFVEVPTFDWIVEKKSFWDIFYEHCNYFTEKTLSVMFENAQTGSFFGGQYIYLWANLAELRATVPVQQIVSPDFSELQQNILKSINFVKNNSTLAIWGAGGKGSTYLNLIDPDRKFIEYVIDINPAKQGKYISGSGHQIYSPDILHSKAVKNILVMNEIYLDEIKNTLAGRDMSIYAI